MYNKIKSHPTVRQIYADQLVREKVISKDRPNELVQENRAQLEKGASVAKNLIQESHNSLVYDWSKYFEKDWRQRVKTGISSEKIKQLSSTLLAITPGTNVHPRVAKIYEERALMAKGELPMDWGFAETMAYASLLEEGYSVRISGQDSGRGTFFHRHVVIHDQKTGATDIPLTRISPNQPQFTVIDSLLSEEAVLAFEYGYSTTDPTSLVIWEAQFGDFANGAQVVVDQFISSGEQKWGRLCNLVMLLPHGYEGQGPEHSSARLERYLQLCAQHNIQVCVPSNAAQIFHLLRRQMIRSMRKPLVIMSPKSLLRLKAAANDVSELKNDGFLPIIPEIEKLDVKAVSKVVLCSGKVYYDILAKRQETKKNHAAIVRIEQLYPFPEPELKKVLEEYPNAKEVVWCQEEPENQGAWYSSQHHMRACLNEKQKLTYAGRPASASPAVGYHQAHVEQQEALVNDALK